jgi:transcription elongation factor Elf1
MDIIEKDVDGEFHVCEKCGYELGFHVSFVKKKGDFEIVLICPNCEQRYRVKWNVTLG